MNKPPSDLRDALASKAKAARVFKHLQRAGGMMERLTAPRGA
jgi:hypothetical protein